MSRFRWLMVAALALFLMSSFASRSGNHGLAGGLSLAGSGSAGVAFYISLRSRYAKGSRIEGSTSAPIVAPPAPGNEFFGDLGAAVRAWSASPWLPVFTVVLSVVGTVGTSSQFDPLVILCAVLLPVLSVGFYGTQRIWYLRVFRGLSMTPSEVWSFSWSLFGRYFVLGVLVTVPLLPLLIGYLLTVNRRSGPGAAWIVGLIVIAVLFDFLLTFVTPELAFRTRSAVQALDTGIRMIRRLWPAGAYYVFVPPLAIQILVYELAGIAGTSLIGIGVASAVAALISLLFKGAVTAFYLRHVPGIGDDGAVHFAHPATQLRTARLAERESAT